MNTCPCGQPTPEASWLCTSCVNGAWNALAAVPELVEELETTRTRQARTEPAGSAGIGGEGALPWHEGAARALGDLGATLGILGAAVGYRGPSELVALSRAVMPHVDTLAAGSVYLELHRVIWLTGRAQRVIDRPPERIYAGPCGLCGADLYALGGVTEVTCQVCGTAEDVARRRAFLLSKVDDQLATATETARALTSLDLPVTPERLRQWKHRGRLVTRGHGPTGHPLYRVGDVIELLVETATGTRTPPRSA